MIVIPAIDVHGGRCVRLMRGDYARETIYSEEPVQVALDFVRAGAARVHLVDLDAARGVPDVLSRDAVRAAVRALADAHVEVQLGGGVRSQAAVRSWLDQGASFLVLGSLAVREPETARALCAEHPGAILLGLDVRDGTAQAQGWTEEAGDAADHLRRWQQWPAAGVIRTEIGRDGTMLGPDLPGLADTIEVYGGPVIASGGIGSLDDLCACAAAGAAGAIVGRALYEGTVELSAALELFPPAPKAAR